MDGLTMKNGRPINNRPEPEMGLSKMARLRKEMKRAEKVQIVADGNAMAKAREEMRSILKK